MYTKEQKIKTAQRLKELRKNKGLSHKALLEELQNNYNKAKSEQQVKKDSYVSIQSLKDWEISEEFNIKFDKGYGMAIHYLCALADLYGVSTDYLLGRTNIASTNDDIQVACKVTGLTEEAISKLTTNVTFNAPLTVPPELIPHNNETNKAKLTPKFFEYIENQPNLLTKTLNDILESNPSFFTPIAFLFYGDFTDVQVNPTIKMGDYEFTLMRDKDIVQNGILDMVRDNLKWLYNKIRKGED